MQGTILSTQSEADNTPESFDCSSCGARGSIRQRTFYIQPALLKNQHDSMYGSCDCCGTTLKLYDVDQNGNRIFDSINS